MKLKNLEILSINNVLSRLADEKIKGAFKFKLFKNKIALESAIEPVQKAIEGVDDQEEINDIYNQEQDVDFELFTEQELENLPLSIRDLVALKPAINLEGNE